MAVKIRAYVGELEVDGDYEGYLYLREDDGKLFDVLSDLAEADWLGQRVKITVALLDDEL